jgi:hypothetical protein
MHRRPHPVFETGKLARRRPGTQFRLQQLPNALAFRFGGRMVLGQPIEVTVSAHALHSGC